MESSFLNLCPSVAAETKRQYARVGVGKGGGVWRRRVKSEKVERTKGKGEMGGKADW